MGWLDDWEDGDRGHCEAGCELDLTNGSADGCLRACTADCGKE